MLGPRWAAAWLRGLGARPWMGIRLDQGLDSPRRRPVELLATGVKGPPLFGPLFICGSPCAAFVRRMFHSNVARHLSP